MAASEVLKRLEEIESGLSDPCPCCDGDGEPYTHADDCTYDADCPAEYEEQRARWDMAENTIWLCTRLRDALVVIEALHIKECRQDLLPLSGYPFIHASNDPKWTFGTCGDEAVVAAYRRLFGEGGSRG